MRRYLDWGFSASTQHHIEVDRTRKTAVSELERYFKSFDAIVLPTTPQVVFSFSVPPPVNQGAFSVLANMVGSPAISMPMGINDEELPIGLQIMVSNGEEQRLLEVASSYEASAALNLAPPPPFGPFAAASAR